MKVNAKLVAPVVVLVAAAIVTTVMIVRRPGAEASLPKAVPPLVQVVRATPGAVKLTVAAQGTVEPRTESDLVTEVAGRIVWVSPHLASGGFFEQGDVLVRIDPRDYEVTLEGARAALARAESNLDHADSTLKRQHSMRERNASSRQALEDALQARANADAGLREAAVAVRRAELNLERTEVRAPFRGRVRTKHVDVGRYVVPGVAAARIYSIDYAEVRLPISDADLAYLDLPDGDPIPGGEPGDGLEAPAMIEASPRVALSADYAGQRQSWTGHVVRTEGALDARTRMINVVARVDDPYGRRSEDGRSPLPVGLFVDAEIEGVEVDGVFEVPRSALRRDDSIWVVDDEDRLHVRRIEVLRFGRDYAWIRSGLEAGERVVTSSLEIVTDGMQVRTTELVGDRQGAGPSEGPTS